MDPLEQDYQTMCELKKASTVLARCIEELRQNPRQTSTELAHKLNVYPSMLSSLLYKSMKRGKINRAKADKPRRGWEWFVPATVSKLY